MIYAIAAVLVLIADQAVKFWTTKNIVLDAIGEECKQLIPGLVHMTNVHNYGAAFSILENAKWLLIAVSVIFVIGIIVLISLEIIRTPFGKWTAVLVMAGAIGNCIDRILYGYVVDMFEFEFFTFAVFNVADIFISVCGILFCIHVILYKDPEEIRATGEPERAPRRRSQREVKDDPYAAIPHRGEHRSLEDELRLDNPDDPFAEWSLEEDVRPAPRRARRAADEMAEAEEPAPRRSRAAAEEEPPAPRRARRAAAAEEEEAPAPRRTRKAAPVEEEAEPAPRARKSASAATEEPASRRSRVTEEEEVPAPAQQSPADDLDFGDDGFSLEDILSEFRDL